MTSALHTATGAALRGGSRNKQQRASSWARRSTWVYRVVVPNKIEAIFGGLPIDAPFTITDNVSKFGWVTGVYVQDE